MPYPKFKSENYANFGGMNTKASQYVTGPNEFLNLLNVDGRRPGSLSSFAGTTQFTVGNGSTSRITGIFDQYTGYFSSATFSLNTQSYAIIATDMYHACDVTGTTFPTIFSYLYPNNINPMSFVQAGQVFGANGLDFWTKPGITAWLFSLPKPVYPIYYTNFIVGFTSRVQYITTFGQTLAAGAPNFLQGNIVLYWAFVRADGLYGPMVYATYQLTPGAAFSGIAVEMPYLNQNLGPTGISAGNFGISGIQAWLSIDRTGGSGILSTPLGSKTLLGYSNVTGGSGKSLLIGFSLELFTLLLPQPEDFQGTYYYGAGSTQGSDGSTYIGSYNPSVTEWFSNQLFVSGLSQYPNTVFFSRIGEPEKSDYEDNFLVGIGDNEMVSCMKAYFTQMVIWKATSTWVLSGSDPDSFILSQVSPIYGCLSSRSACIWNQNLWFLDRKGICEFNGANTEIVSAKVQPLFDRMNVAAARTEAIMIHVKERNEVWCAIPVDGATRNNLLVVYDYLSGQWYSRSLSRPLTAMALISSGNNKQTVYAGWAADGAVFGHTGLDNRGYISTFGSSFVNEDDGTALTAVIKSRFFCPENMGHSVEKMFRRLYIDATIPSGATYVLPVNLYTNQGTSPALSTTLVLTEFQKRIDFGLTGRDLSIELFYSGATFLQLNGFTIDYRFQRGV